MSIGALGKWYESVSHLLRRNYKWDPFVIDAIPLNRLVKIVEELIDDLEERKNSPGMDEEDFE